MPAVALEIGDGHVVAARDGHAVVLVNDDAALYHHVTRGANIEAIRVVRGSQALADAVGRVACRVVQHQILEHDIGAARDGEEMNGPVLNVQILDHRISRHFLDDNEMIRFGHASIGAQAVPICLAIAINDGSRVGCYRNPLAANGDEVEGRRVGETKGRQSVKCHRGTGLETRKVDCGFTGDRNVGQDDVGARGYSSRDLGVGRADTGCARRSGGGTRSGRGGRAGSCRSGD